jgi:hypothetical protein
MSEMFIARAQTLVSAPFGGAEFKYIIIFQEPVRSSERSRMDSETAWSINISPLTGENRQLPANEGRGEG